MNKGFLIGLVIVLVLGAGGVYYYKNYSNASADVAIRSDVNKIYPGIAFRTENLNGRPLSNIRVVGTYYVRGKYENENDIWLGFDFDESTNDNGMVLVADSKIKTQKKFFPGELIFKNQTTAQKFVDMDPAGIYVSYSARIPSSNQYISKASDGLTVIFPELLSSKKTVMESLFKQVAGAKTVNVDNNFVSVRYTDLDNLNKMIKAYFADSSVTNGTQVRTNLEALLKVATGSTSFTMKTLPDKTILTAISTAFDAISAKPETIGTADVNPLKTALQSASDSTDVKTASTTATDKTASTEPLPLTQSATEDVQATASKELQTISYDQTSSTVKSFNFRYSVGTSKVELIKVNQQD